jgi:hypothetical protein
MRCRLLLAILLLSVASCGGNSTEPEKPILEPPAAGFVTLDLSGTVFGPDGREAGGLRVIPSSATRLRRT